MSEAGAIQRITTIRAFIAIRLSVEVETAIGDFIDELRTPNDGIGWTRRDKLHVTLKFLGAKIDSEKIAPLVEALRPITDNAGKFHVKHRGVGGFPNLHRPRVLWTGLQSDALAQLAAQIEVAATSVGFDRSDRPWSPHLTVARIRHPRKIKTITPRLEASSDRDFGESPISEVVLYRSHLSSKGSTYESLATFPF